MSCQCQSRRSPFEPGWGENFLCFWVIFPVLQSQSFGLCWSWSKSLLPFNVRYSQEPLNSKVQNQRKAKCLNLLAWMWGMHVPFVGSQNQCTGGIASIDWLRENWKYKVSWFIGKLRFLLYVDILSQMLWPVVKIFSKQGDRLWGNCPRQSDAHK